MGVHREKEGQVL